jgi:hypothetical protein
MSSSSVITQQVQGLATATSPGLVGTGAQTWAGVKTFQSGAVVAGDTSSNLISSGNIGEFSGSVNAGTGGAVYYTVSTTAITSSATVLNSVTLNKGKYFFNFYHAFQNPDATTHTVTYYVRIGGTNCSPAFLQDKTTNIMAGCFSMALPIIITSDSTVLSLVGVCAGLSGAALNNQCVISGFRCA